MDRVYRRPVRGVQPLWIAGLIVTGAALVSSVPLVAQGVASTAIPAGSRTPAATAFVGMTVIDVRTGQRHPNHMAIVVGTRIQAIGPAGKVSVPKGARIIRADGTYMIPGLWDMHVHSYGYPDIFYPAFLANGVTGVREMATPMLDSVLRWRREIAAGVRPGPRVVTTGPSIQWGEHAGARGHFLTVTTAEDARRTIDSLRAHGVDFLKFYGALDTAAAERAIYFAVAAQARRVGLPLTGHVPRSVTPEEASDSGQRSIEHELAGCFNRWPFGQFANGQPPLEGCRAMAEKLRRNKTWLTVGPLDRVDECHMPGEGRLRPADCQMPHISEQRRYWADSMVQHALGPLDSVDFLARRIPGVSLEQWAALHRNPSLRLRRIREMHDAGVRLLAGTDVSPPVGFGLGVLPAAGFSLHELLWNFVRGGLTPLEALRTVTLNPVEYFGADSLGVIESGRLADFVLLDADPLVDIFNTRRIRAVVANGRFFDRGDLDELLQKLAQTARTARFR